MTIRNINYQNIVIYKIVCNDLNIKELYVGSTSNFRMRKYQHKECCNDTNSKSHNSKLYTLIRKNNGWDNWTMIEIEKYPCNDGNEARSRERYWYEKLNASLNSIKPITTSDEIKLSKAKDDKNYYEKHKEKITQYKKEYAIKNEEKINSYAKLYRDNNKEKKQLTDKLYREANKEAIQLQKKQYREANKEIIKQKKKEYYEKTKVIS